MMDLPFRIEIVGIGPVLLILKYETQSFNDRSLIEWSMVKFKVDRSERIEVEH